MKIKIHFSTFYNKLPEFMSTLNVNNENTDLGQVPLNSQEAKPNEEEVTTTTRPIRPIRASRLLSKEPDTSMKIKKRTIQKPNKTKINIENVADLYLKQKIERNFKPTSLETIDEECENVFDLTNGRKIKRSLSCSDGLNYTKKTIIRRRQKIKKTFGRRYALKVTRISLDVFFDRLNASFDETNSAKCEE